MGYNRHYMTYESSCLKKYSRSIIETEKSIFKLNYLFQDNCRSTYKNWKAHREAQRSSPVHPYPRVAPQNDGAVSHSTVTPTWSSGRTLLSLTLPFYQCTHFTPTLAHCLSDPGNHPCLLYSCSFVISRMLKNHAICKPFGIRSFQPT